MIGFTAFSPRAVAALIRSSCSRAMRRTSKVWSAMRVPFLGLLPHFLSRPTTSARAGCRGTDKKSYEAGAGTRLARDARERHLRKVTGTPIHCLQPGFFLLGFRNLRHNPRSFELAPSNGYEPEEDH